MHASKVRAEGGRRSEAGIPHLVYTAHEVDGVPAGAAAIVGANAGGPVEEVGRGAALARLEELDQGALTSRAYCWAMLLAIWPTEVVAQLEAWEESHICITSKIIATSLVSLCNFSIITLWFVLEKL